MDQDSIPVKCKKCGRFARADEFILDLDYKMMVCQQCVKEKRMKHEVHSELAKQKEQTKEDTKEPKPAGWDHEDEYLSRNYKTKMMDSVKVVRIDAQRVKYKCPKCGYTFTYDVERSTPGRCPYCGEDIHQIRYQ